MLVGVLATLSVTYHQNHLFFSNIGTKYSRMDKVKFVEDSL